MRPVTRPRKISPIDVHAPGLTSDQHVRSMLGISPSAYEEACDVLGQVGAAIVIGCIFERAAHINSAGGYLRDLTAKAKRGEFSLGPMLFTQLRANSVGLRTSA